MVSGTQRRALRSSVYARQVIAVLAAVGLLLIPGHADASVPQIGVLLLPGSGGGSPLPKTPVPTVTNETTVEVKVPANTTLTPGASVKILACADADGKADDLPLSAATCDGLTINTGRTINVASDGSVDKTDYTIYKLPMTSEPSDQSTVCNGTSACVLYIGQDQNDFNQPHVWSQPFLVSCTGATCGDSTSSSVAAPTTSSPSGSQPAGSNADSSASVTLGSGSLRTVRPQASLPLQGRLRPSLGLLWVGVSS